MKELYILIVIALSLVVALIGLYGLEKLLIRRARNNVLSKLKTLGEIEKDGKHYFLIMGSKQIQILFLSLKNTQHLTVNSKTFMQMDNTRNKKPIIFKYNYQNGLFKWLIIAPGINRVKRAINENEVEFITYQNDFDNFKIIRDVEVDQLIKLYKE